MWECLGRIVLGQTAAAKRIGMGHYPDRDENGREIGFACQVCENCRKNQAHAWVGRLLAEQQTSVAANFITLTYGHDDRYKGTGLEGAVDHPHARKLVYGDMQRYFKRVRSADFPLSYLATGEYGTLKGRAHWHVAAFWQREAPEHTIGRNWNDQFWPDGVVDWKEMHEVAAAYICQYMVSPQPPEANPLKFAKVRPSLRRHKFTYGMMARMSKVPPLGHRYFVNRARLLVEDGKSPQDGVYTFPGVVIDKGPLFGQPKHFFLTLWARDRFIKAFLDYWKELRPYEAVPASPFLDDYYDRMAARDVVLGRGKLEAFDNMRRTGTYYGPGERV